MNKKVVMLSTSLWISFLAISAPNGQKKVVGYFTNWGIYRPTPYTLKPEMIDGSLLTHINYAFAKVDVKGNVMLVDPWADTQIDTNWSDPDASTKVWGNFKKFMDLKKKYPHLKTVISIGGWTLSDQFSTLASNPQARSQFARNAADFMIKYGFNGVDIDWEFPGFADHAGRPEDTVNFTLLLKELRTALDAAQPGSLLTIAAPAAPEHYQKIELQKIGAIVDWINLMTYDFFGSWSPVTNHNAPLYAPAQGDPLYNCDAAIRYYLDHGVPSEKLLLGLPFYGRSFAEVKTTNSPLFKPFNGPADGSTAEKGILFFSDLVKNYLPQKKIWQQSWDEKAHVPYLFNQITREFISFDDERSLKEKVQYALTKKLGGVMIWELGGDTIGSWDGLKAINATLSNGKKRDTRRK